MRRVSRNDERPSWLRARAAASANTLALHFDDTHLTFGELYGRVRAASAELHEAGVRAGTRVGLLAESGVEFVLAVHALSEIGAVSVPLNGRLLPDDHYRQLRLVNARLLMHDDSGEATAAATGAFGGRPIGGLRLAELGGHLPGTRTNLPSVHPELISVTDATERLSSQWMSPPFSGTDVRGAPHVDQLHTIVFTSGTTGAGKAVPLTYGNHWWNAFGSLLNLGSQSAGMWLDCLPLYHVGGLSILLRSVLYGTPVLLHRGFDARRVSEDLDSGEITMISLVSTMLVRVLDSRGDRPFPPALHCILLGGGPIPESLIRRCLAVGVPIAPTWGMTETASQAATLRPEELANHPGSAGRALMGLDIAIAGAVDAAEGPAEIMVSGPSVASGYLHQERGSSAIVGSANPRVSREPAAKPEGTDSPGPALDTGDLGYLDPDGYLYISGRRDDLIVTGGENVFPSEVESVLLSHPAVADVGVFGLPNDEWGSVVAAAVVVRDPEPAVESLAEFCRERLPGYKCPRQITIVTALPRTASGKLRRVELPALVGVRAGATRPYNFRSLRPVRKTGTLNLSPEP